MPTETIVEHGLVPCRECKKPHVARRRDGELSWGTWADPDDGHPYQRMDAIQVVMFVRDGGEV